MLQPNCPKRIDLVGVSPATLAVLSDESVRPTPPQLSTRGSCLFVQEALIPILVDWWGSGGDN